MTIAYWCVLVAAVIPLISIGIAKAGGERYNNRHPRVWLDKQQGYRARAAAAEANSFEAFPFFAAAVIIAHLTNAPQARHRSAGGPLRDRSYRLRRLLSGRLALGLALQSGLLATPLASPSSYPQCGLARVDTGTCGAAGKHRLR